MQTYVFHMCVCLIRSHLTALLFIVKWSIFWEIEGVCKDLRAMTPRQPSLPTEAPASHSPCCSSAPVCERARCGTTRGKPVIKQLTKWQ